MQGSARKHVVFVAAWLYTVTVPGKSWLSCQVILIGVLMLVTLRPALLLVLAGLSTLPASAQGIGGQGGTPLPGARPRNPGQPQQTGIEMRRNMYLEGQVTLEDGSSPGAPVVIQMYCNGQTRPVGYSNLKGYFSFRPAENSREATGDASRSGVPGGPEGGPTGTLANDGFDDPLNIAFGGLGGTTTHGSGTIDLTGCEVRAELTGYRPSRLPLGRRSIGDSDLGTFVLRSINKAAGNSVRVTSLQLPDKGHKMFEKVLKEMGKKEPNVEKAVGELEKTVDKFPKFAAAWSMLGTCGYGHETGRAPVRLLERPSTPTRAT